jgi:adenylate cyclase
MIGLRRLRVLLHCAATAMIVAHLTGHLPIAFLERIDHTLYDLRMRSNPVDVGGNPDIVIVDIDEESLSRIGRWPWNRSILARLVDRLFDDYGVQVLGMDIAFPEPDDGSDSLLLQRLGEPPYRDEAALQQAVAELRYAVQHDQVLAAALAGRRVVLGHFLGFGERSESKGAPPRGLQAVDDTPFAESLHGAASYTGNLELLQIVAEREGFINNVDVDDDGVYRRYPMLMRLDDRVIPSLFLSMYLEIQESDVAQADSVLDLRRHEDFSGTTRLTELCLAFNRQDYQRGRCFQRIPVDRNGAALIPFAGPPGSFGYLPAWRVLEGEATLDLAGRYVLLGSTAAGLGDRHATPVAGAFPGVEIHANLLSGLLRESSIPARGPYLPAVELAAAVLVSLALAVLLPVLSAVWISVATLGIAGAVLLTDQLLWATQLQAMRSAAPLALLLLLYAVHMFFGYFLESRRQRRLARVFGQYIPPRLVRDLQQDEAELTLSGESREMTVLFSDIRGFTTLSEQMDSQELCRLINAILTQLTAVIHRHGGTVDKYIGDAVMAFWGAPQQLSDHAPRAVAAALDMVEALQALAPRFAEEGWPPVAMGIGINSGRMSVGNMGSEFRLSYTVMGDAVNLASRLEHAAPPGGILVSAEVVRRTRARTPSSPARDRKSTSIPPRIEIRSP